jgi:hypothetical protein
VAAIGLAIAAIPIPGAVLRLAWIALVLLGTLWLCIRAWRMEVSADALGLHVRNLDRDHDVPWSEVQDLIVEAITGGDATTVPYVVLHRTDGSRMVLGATSAYRRPVVDVWCSQLRAARGTVR